MLGLFLRNLVALEIKEFKKEILPTGRHWAVSLVAKLAKATRSHMRIPVRSKPGTRYKAVVPREPLGKAYNDNQVTLGVEV